MARLIFVGAGDFAREVCAWMLSSRSISAEATDICFIDDATSVFRAGCRNLTYLGTIDTFFPLPGDQLVPTISSPLSRSLVVHKLLSRSCTFISYLHPSVHVSLGSSIGQGCILLPNSLISNDSTIADFSIVNTCSSIGHDVRIGSFVTICSHVDVMGHSVVENQVFLGSGSRILPGKCVGEGAVIGAGAIAARSVPRGKTLYAPLSKLL